LEVKILGNVEEGRKERRRKGGREGGREGRKALWAQCLAFSLPPLYNVDTIV